MSRDFLGLCPAQLGLHSQGHSQHQAAQPMHLRKHFQKLGLTGNQQVAIGLGGLRTLLSCFRPSSGGSQPQFRARPPTHISRSNTGSTNYIWLCGSYQEAMVP